MTCLLSITFRRLTIAGLLVLLTGTTLAEVSIDRDARLTDAAGGALSMTTTGTLEIGGSESLTTATFSNFQPDADGRIFNGEVTRSRYRDSDAIQTRFDGEISVMPAGADAGSDPVRLVFSNLAVTRGGDGPEFSGEVVWNDKVFDAAELAPRGLAAVRRALRFFRWA